MITRVAAAAVGLAFLLPAVIFGGQVAVEIIVVLVSVVCISEYAAMAFPNDKLGGTTIVAALWSAMYFTAAYAPEYSQIAVSLAALATLVLFTLRPGETLDKAVDAAGRAFLGSTWLVFLVFLVSLRRLDDGLAWVFLVLAVSWCGDTGGYFAGKYFGSHKLYPRVSPKKTWEGVAGGITLATVGTLVVREVGLPALGIVDCLVLGPVLCLAGVVGDLSESLMKRAFGVKDSGKIMPGHGGLLDRIDSVLFVAPLLYAYAVIVVGAG